MKNREKIEKLGKLGIKIREFLRMLCFYEFRGNKISRITRFFHKFHELICQTNWGSLLLLVLKVS